MRKSLFLCSLICFLMACGNDATTTPTDDGTNAAGTAQATPESSPVATPQTPVGTLVAPNIPVKGEPGSAISAQTERVIRVLTTDIWAMDAYLRMALEKEEREKLNDENKGRWFQFDTDGQFTAGKYEKTTGKGKWIYDPQGNGEQPFIYLDHEERRDEEFRIQMASDETVMIWIGTKRFGENGIQSKLSNRTGLPPNPANGGAAVKNK